jgi:hypothetical protein
MFGILNYHFVIKKRGSMPSYLMGYGVIIPLAILLPPFLVKSLGIYNTSVSMGFAAYVGMLMPFACTQAMHGAPVPYLEESLSSYLTDYSPLVPYERDRKTGKPIKATQKYLRQRLFHVMVTKFLICIGAFSLVMNFKYYPFGSSDQVWPRMGNNFCHAFLMWVLMDYGDGFYGLISSYFSGNKCINIMQNPLFASQSIAEFWGKRWNQTMHLYFKRGIVKPMYRAGAPRWMIVATVFIVSGLFHEYMCYVISTKHRFHPHYIGEIYVPNYGNLVKFFFYNAAALLLENQLQPMLVPIKKRLPKPVITACVLLSVLPIGQWFTDEYVNSGFFDDIARGLPVIAYSPSV